MVNKMNLQESILKAVNTIVEQRTNELKVDKTITAIVEKNMGIFNGKTLYRLRYEGGFLEAVVLNPEEIYLPNTSVYVLIPQGDFSKQKVIIGRTNNINLEKDSSIINSIENQYCLVGNNLLYNAKKDDSEKISNLQYGVYSYHNPLEENENPDTILHRYNQICSYNSDGQYSEVYNRRDLNQTQWMIYDQNLAFNIESLNILKDQSTGLMVKADFKTNLTMEQRQRSEGEYGLILNLVFDNLNKDYGSTNGEVFEKVAETITGKAYISKKQAYDFKSISEEPSLDDQNLYDYYEIKLKDIHDYYISQVKEYNANIKSNIRLLIEYTNSLRTTFSTNNSTKILYTDIVSNTLTGYLDFLNELELANNLNNFNNIYNIWWNQNIGDTENKTIAYKISSNNMIGNPLSFNQWNTQRQILDIDIKNLIRIDSIILYKQGFLENSESELNWPLNNPGPDIFVKNLQIYPVKPIESQNEDYILKVQPKNSDTDSNAGVLTGTESIDRVIFEASLIRKGIENLSKNTRASFLWFKEDFSITDVNSSGYDAIAGIGWKRIPLARGYNFVATGNDNLAYKNNYKCVVQYIENEDNTIVLDTTFSVYNKSISTDILLESDIGTTFSFFEDNIKPKVICRINENLNDSDTIENYHEIVSTDETYPKYRYYWAITDSINGNKIFLNDVDNKSIDEINNVLAYVDAEDIVKDIKYYKLNNNLEEIPTKKSIEATRIVYPVNKLSSGFTVNCFVKKKMLITGSNYIRYVDAGSATLEFLNKGLDIDLNSFKITIENGNQVFQYDEYGNAPTSDKNKEPLEILPIRAKVFAPSGAEIKSSNYSVEWIFPTENTMINAKEILESDSEENSQIYKGQICDFKIVDLYNPDFWNNQITCHVTYNNQSLYKDTNFLFTKIGENGTNGTDVVAKIYYTGDDVLNTLHSQPLTLYAQDIDNGTNITTKAMFNVPDGNGKRRALSDVLAIIGEKGILDVALYQKGNTLSSNNYASTYPRWNLLGNISYSQNYGKYFTIEKNSNDSYDINWSGSVNNSQKDLYQIIKAEVQLKTGQTYYATYNIPFIWYTKDSGSILDVNNLIAIDRSHYLSSILYNADGRNPIYNHNQGLKFINIPENIDRILWEAKGDISLLLEDNTSTKIFEKTENISAEEMIFILPDDIYDGGITTNHIQVSFYDKDKLIAIAYVPIYMSLNTFGLASLNAWDGNHITVNEDEGYVLSPQIGAGEKDENNRFTGILMGKTEGEVGHTGEIEAQTGLFGYVNGIQSIFLDAKTGNATFGLPNGLHLDENGNLEKGNNFNEGRIELRPGKESVIGGWTLGNRSLYYTSKKEIDDNNNEKWVYSGQLEKRQLHDYIPNWKTGLIEKDLKDNYFKHHERDIKYDESGILLYAGESPYISIKGRPFSKTEVPENEISEKESLIRPNDSIELQLDTATPTLFTIFRHNGGNREGIEGVSGNEEQYELGSRTFLAGINSQGEFIANSLRSANTTDIVIPAGSDEERTWKAGSLITKFAINTLNAFDDFAYDPVPKTSHIGFEITANEENTLAHFFTKINGLKVKGSNEIDENYNPTLHISGGYTDEDGEYSRPLALHGRNIQMYALDGSGRDPLDDKFLSETDAGLKISTDEAKLQLGSTHFNLFRDTIGTNNINTLTTANDLQINVGEEVLNDSMVEEFNAGNNNWKPLNTQLDYNKYKKFNAEDCYVQDKDSLDKVVRPVSNKYVNLSQMNKYLNRINSNMIMKYYINPETRIFTLMDELNFYYKSNLRGKDEYISINSYNNDIYYKNIKNEVKRVEDIYRFDADSQNYYALNSETKSELNNESLNQYFVFQEKDIDTRINEQYDYMSEENLLNNLYYINENNLDNYIKIDNYRDIYYKRQDPDGRTIYIKENQINSQERPFIIIEDEENIFGYIENVQHYWRDSFDEFNLYFKINIDEKAYYVTNFILDTYLMDENNEWQLSDSKEFFSELPDHSYWYQKYYEETASATTRYVLRPTFIDDYPENGQVEFEMANLSMVDFNTDASFNNTNILNIYKKYEGEIVDGMSQYLLKDEVERAKSYYYYKNSTNFYSKLENDEDNQTYYKLKDLDGFIEIATLGELFYYSEKFNSYISLDNVDTENVYLFENNSYQEIENTENNNYSSIYRRFIVPKTFSDYEWISLDQWLGGELLKEYCLTEEQEYILKESFPIDQTYLKINDRYVFIDFNLNNFNYIYIEDNKSSEPFFISINYFKQIAEDKTNRWLFLESEIYDIGDKGWKEENEYGIIYNENAIIRQSPIFKSYSNQAYSLYNGTYKNYIQKDNNIYTKIDIDKNIDIKNTRLINLQSYKNLDFTLLSSSNTCEGQISLRNTSSSDFYSIDGKEYSIYGQFVRVEKNNEQINKYGLLLGDNFTSLLGEDLNYIKSKKQIKITSAETGSGLIYTAEKPQILLIAGEDGGIKSTKLILNSSDNGWKNRKEDSSILSYPAFKVQSRYGYIGIFPWYETDKSYSEQFYVGMSQIITHGLQIQGKYGNNKDINIGLMVSNDIQANKFIGQNWNSLFSFPQPKKGTSISFGSGGSLSFGWENPSNLTFSVPKITIKEKGQPSITTNSVSITLPNAQNIWDAIFRRLERYINNRSFLTTSAADSRYAKKSSLNNYVTSVSGTLTGSHISINYHKNGGTYRVINGNITSKATK